MDRRVKYTRRVLNESLIKLLETKEIARITVKELCADADINRSTYYAHFTDPFDQLAQLKAAVLGELTEFTQAIDIDRYPAIERPYRVLRTLLQYVETRRPMFQTLLNKSGDRDMQHDVLTLLGEKAFPSDKDNALSPEKRSYFLIYASNGCFGMFYTWLMDENPIPSDRLAHLMADFTRSVLV